MQKKLPIKAIGVIATLLGMGVTLISGWVEDQKTSMMIDEKIDEALAKREEETTEEEES